MDLDDYPGSVPICNGFKRILDTIAVNATVLVASLIDRLDKRSDSYQKNMADLVSIGACIWQMKSSELTHQRWLICKSSL